jgi:hypothetical protein
MFDPLMDHIRASGIINGSWRRSNRQGPTAVGKTAEDILGVVENNSKDSDLPFGVEVKATRINSESLTTLFTSSPKHMDGRRGVIRSLCSEYGQKSEFDRLQLYMTVSPHTSLKSRVDNNQVVIYNSENGDLAKRNIPVFEAVIRRKIKNVVLFKAESRIYDQWEEFRFVEALYLSNADINRFLQCLNDGVIKIDFRAHLNTQTKRVRDHGTGFRIDERDYGRLFGNVEKIMGH